MRKLTSLIGLLVVLSMLLAACTTPTTVVVETPEVIAVETPVVEEPVVEEPVVEEEVILNPYLGSNKLDGNGIPADFFQDIHIRKAFAYCFDWETVINDVYKGEAVQSITLSLPGMPGYDLESPAYSMDLDQCAAEFKLADVDKDGVPAETDRFERKVQVSITSTPASKNERCTRSTASG